MTPEEITKICKLLTHDDLEYQRQGLALAKSFGDYSAVFDDSQSLDSSYSLSGDKKEIKIPFGRLNTSILEVFLGSGLVDTMSITNLTIDDYSQFQNFDILASLGNLTSLILKLPYSGKNRKDLDLSGLASLDNLASLTINGGNNLDLSCITDLSNLGDLDLLDCYSSSNKPVIKTICPKCWGSLETDCDNCDGNGCEFCDGSGCGECFYCMNDWGKSMGWTSIVAGINDASLKDAPKIIAEFQDLLRTKGGFATYSNVD